MIHRIQKSLIRKRLNQFPAVCIVGPRQAGKTTLAKDLSQIYFDLEQESDRLKLDLLWHDLMEKDQLIILDEAQTWPEVFPRLRGAIDARRNSKGRFLLLGSVSPSLMKQVGESLAGRMAIVDLPPLTVSELPSDYSDSLWKNGGFPDGGVLDPTVGSYPVWQESYLRQMTHQDLPAWGLPSKPQQTDRLIRMIAAVHGSQLNASQLGQGLGVSYHTVQSHVDFLEGAFLIRKLPPFYVRNFPKRLTKTPKIYWRDSGLLHFLLGLPANSIPPDQPWAGQSWEGWVIEQIITTRQASGEIFSAHYFRTGDGLECDLLLETNHGREIIEIKLSSNPSSETFSKLSKIANLVGANRQVVISRIPDEAVVMTEKSWSINLHSYLSQYSERKPSSSIFRTDDEVSQPAIFALLEQEAGGLLREGVLSTEDLMRRASLLAADLKIIAPKKFHVLPPRTVVPPGSDLFFILVEYGFDGTEYDINNSDDPFKIDKNVKNMDGSGLDRESLLYLSKVSEIGHTLIPDLWPLDADIRQKLKTGSQHLNTLNEIWWLSRWHGIDEGSIQADVVIRTDIVSTRKKKAPDVDWSFTVLGGQMRINLEVKNRPGTKGSQPFSKNTYLFSDKPEEKFRPSASEEINVLAVTAYHGGHIPENDEASMVENYLNSLSDPAIDAVALMVKGSNGSYEKLYFPTNRELNKKDLILKALFKPMDSEDHSYVGTNRFPISWQQALEA